MGAVAALCFVAYRSFRSLDVVVRYSLDALLIQARVGIGTLRDRASIVFFQGSLIRSVFVPMECSCVRSRAYLRILGTNAGSNDQTDYVRNSRLGEQPADVPPSTAAVLEVSRTRPSGA